MHNLRDVLKHAEEKGVVGHFNIADLVLLNVLFASARELNVPVLVGASDGEREFMGVRQIATLVRNLREESASTTGADVRSLQIVGQIWAQR